MAASTGFLTPYPSSLFPKTTNATIPKRLIPCAHSQPVFNFRYPKLSCLPLCSPTGFSAVLAVVDEEAVAVEDNVDENEEDVDVSVQESKNRARPCELYVCNLPRSYDISELVEMFKPFGTVISVEVSRSPDTGISRGCGYVTMATINSAKNAIAALDGSDVGGRQMRVRFSVDMSIGKRNTEALNSTPRKILICESPHKLYVGNLAWGVKPKDLGEQFSQFGTVVSASVLHDRKGGNNRVFAFLSFSSAAERDAAFALNGTNFRGRTLIVRKGVERTEP
ncbi:RNA-binding protein CP33, chloroplastic-like [Pistacia vera]|uniref:RNA-binding protein CP33, chloroplastic-like n=1 Tax=Pistacia vera TaxID=55513 RepID=UPI001263396B|nr:RNA-binding protein CP33, chloroplastic-like [Pistacia vera]